MQRNHVPKKRTVDSNFPLKADATYVPATGRRVAFSQAIHTPHPFTTESTTFGTVAPTPSAAVRMRLIWVAGAWPQITRDFFTIKRS